MSGAVGIVSSIAAKDSVLLRRESLLLVLALAVAALFIVALFVGLQREAEFAGERTAAEAVDREVWLSQGDRNPHSAAHFSRYAFRPAAPLALLDPGISDFAGVAVWMEAHYQDPAEFRRAEDSGELSRFMALSPALLFLIAVPLLAFVMLHGSVAGEREDGTLRQLLASGITPRMLFLGKLRAGLVATVPALLGAFAVVAIFVIVTAPQTVDASLALRLGAALVLYLGYLLICIALALAVSALFRTRQTALLAGFGVWVFAVVLLPRLAGDVAGNLYPQEDARALAKSLTAASGAYRADKDRQEQIKQDLLDQYGVATVEDLPINYGAYTLQVGEELAIPEFERFYGELAERHGRQNAVMRWFGLITPYLPAVALSQAVAGTDAYHQSAYLTAAEQHRRQMIRLLNEDYMLNAGEQGREYTGDRTLWERFTNFEHAAPALPLVLAHQGANLALLSWWALAALSAAYALLRRAVLQEGS